MNHQNKTSFKLDPMFKVALQDFLCNIDVIYKKLDLVLSEQEKQKIKEINKRKKNE
jgi:hypothetical protein